MLRSKRACWLQHLTFTSTQMRSASGRSCSWLLFIRSLAAPSPFTRYDLLDVRRSKTAEFCRRFEVDLPHPQRAQANYKVARSAHSRLASRAESQANKHLRANHNVSYPASDDVVVADLAQACRSCNSDHLHPTTFLQAQMKG